jgi:hypothetical protein
MAAYEVQTYPLSTWLNRDKAEFLDLSTIRLEKIPQARRAADRLNWRNGYRDRTLDTLANSQQRGWPLTNRGRADQPLSGPAGAATARSPMEKRRWSWPKRWWAAGPAGEIAFGDEFAKAAARGLLFPLLSRATHRPAKNSLRCPGSPSSRSWDLSTR